MARGKIEAMGTSRELKMSYGKANGLGYHLNVEFKKGVTPDHFREMHVLVAKHVPSTQDMTTLSYVQRAQAIDAPEMKKFSLPFDEIDNFGTLLQEIESRVDDLHVNDYFLAMTTLEEVFMSIGRKA